MSIGGLLGAISGGYSAIQAGIDADQARRDAEEERRYQRERRENARADRAFGLQQRQRVLDEQARVDRIRAGERSIPTTREVDTRNATVKQITVDDEGTPSAAALPVMQTRQSPKWLQIKQRADIYRKEGDLDTAQALDDASAKAQFAESAQRFDQVRAGSGQMSISELAQALQGIYNSDPLPAQVSGYEPTSGGGLRVRVRNSETGREESFEAKSKDDLLSRAEAYFSPQTYAAWVAQQRASAQKTQEALLKPEKLAPGEIQVGGGKVLARNDSPTAAQLRAAGAGGSGSGRAAKDVDSFKPFEDAWEATFKGTDSKFGSPDQSSRAREIGRRIYSDGVRRGAPVDPQIAITIASDLVNGKKQETVFYNPETGQFVKGVEHEGARFALRDVGAPGPRKSNKEVDDAAGQAAAADFLSQMAPEVRTRMLTASLDKNARQQLRNEMEARMRSPEGISAMAQRLGRQPTSADIDREVKAANDLTQRHLDLLGNYADPKLRQQAAKPGAAPGLGLGGGQAGGAEPGADGVSSLDDRTLARLASIQGHASQAAAQAELRRRRSLAGAEMPADAAGMLNIAP